MPAKKVVKKVKAPEVKKAPEVVIPVPADTRGCVECGAPIHEGQTYVCIDHIRSS